MLDCQNEGIMILLWPDWEHCLSWNVRTQDIFLIKTWCFTCEMNSKVSPLIMPPHSGYGLWVAWTIFQSLIRREEVGQMNVTPQSLGFPKLMRTTQKHVYFRSLDKERGFIWNKLLDHHLQYCAGFVYKPHWNQQSPSNILTILKVYEKNIFKHFK